MLMHLHPNRADTPHNEGTPDAQEADDQDQDQHRSESMRLFLLALMLVYGAYGLLFLLVPSRLSATHAGAWFTDHGPASQVWGIAFLAAAALVNASLIWPVYARLRAAGVLLALFVGGAWASAGCAITLFYGADPSQPISWLWATFLIAFTFVQLAPRTRPAWKTLAGLPQILVTGTEPPHILGPTPAAPFRAPSTPERLTGTR